MRASNLVMKIKAVTELSGKLECYSGIISCEGYNIIRSKTRQKKTN